MKLACVLAIALVAASPFRAASLAVRDLGIPVKGVSWVRLHPGQTADGKASLLATMSQNNGGLFVIAIDLATGHCRQFPVQHRDTSTFSTAAFRSLRTGILYIGSAWDGHLHRFDAEHPERGIEDLGKIDPNDAIFPTGLTETPDGAIWMGTCNGARLVKFDPATNAFTRFGKMDEVDNYLYPLAGDDGSLAAIVKVLRPHLIVIDPATGEHREAGPAIIDTTDKSQFLKLVKGIDRRLYLDSHAGKFRVDGMNLTPVDEIPVLLAGIPIAGTHRYQAPLVMPGGWMVQFTDDNDVGGGTPRHVLVTNINPLLPSRQLTLDWVGGGSNLHVFDVGPGGDLYGSSYMPNHLFRARAEEMPSEAAAKPGPRPPLEDLGKHTFAMGEAYSLTTLDDKVYLASYPEARLSVYDPAKPRHFGTGPNDNPRDLGRLDPIGYRPNALIHTPDGRIWMGSAPDYGLVGGTLAWFDPKNGEKKSHRGIVPELSPAALLYLPAQKQILVGLSIEAGTGAKPKRQAGAFALWDPGKDELAWSGDLGLDDLADVSSLAAAGNGLVYALLGRGDHILSQGAPAIAPRLVLIDPMQRRVVASAWLPKDFGPVSWHGLFALKTDARGQAYGATAYCIFRIKPGTCDVERVWQESQPHAHEGTVWLTASDPNVIDVVGPIVGDQFYFATGWRLRALTLPQ
ncbi:MAG: hypothetical protein JWM32_2646 [Verrucomicrobia bacterium]|nr:hypothetical protein [Verrucomicrobiota bacterium]